MGRPAWDPVKTWTDEEWEQARQDAEDGPFAYGPDAPATAAEKNAEETEHHKEELARSDAYSTALGTSPVRTMGDVLDYMIACGVIIERLDGNKTVYDLNPGAALPGEVLPLSETDLAAEDHLRWRDTHESTAQPIIALFRPEEQQQVERKKTSLERLARELDSDVESVRAGVLNLLADSDFTATIDVERAEPHKVFELVVDWELFNTNRISLHLASGGHDDEDGGEEDSPS